MERWRAFFGKANADIWTVIEQAINVAAVDHPEVFREKRGDIAETLFARRLLQVVPSHDEVASLGVLDDIDEHPTSAMEEGELKDDADERAPTACLDDEAHRLHPCYDEAVVLREDVDQEVALIEEINSIKQSITGDSQPENYLLELLQKLKDMQITVHALKVTEIGKQVNVLRKHSSKYVRAVAKQLVKHWKFLVDEWVKSDGEAAEVGVASPVAAAGLQNRDEPDVANRLRLLLSPPATEDLSLPLEKGFSGELTKLFSFIDDEDLCGQNKRGVENDMDCREHSVKGSMQNSSRSHSGSALTYSSDCDARISSSQAWGIQTPGEMGSATRDNHTSERIEKLLEPAPKTLLAKNEMAHSGANHISGMQPSSKAPTKPVSLAKISSDSSKPRVSSDEAVARRSANDHSQRSHYAQKASAPHGSGNAKNVKPSMPNKLSDKSQVEQKLEIAKRKLHQGYQQAENAKKQRTVQVLEFPDLPKSSETRGKMNAAVQSKAGSQAGHWSQMKRHG
ncbi:hypothetical protein GOP47_0028385 [Adiantum capillus-veneris]|nr:hypothetical protein GOP47_0028385 [Adiantum capillus-veneris]